MDRYDMMDAICKTLQPGEELEIHVTSARGQTLVNEFILTKEGYKGAGHHWNGPGTLRDEYRRRVIEKVKGDVDVKQELILKESQPVGLDVWLETGVHVEGYPVFDANAKQEAKKKLIDMIQNDECDFHWLPLYD